MRRRPFLLMPALGLPAMAQGKAVLVGAEDDWYPYSAERHGRAEGIAVDLVAAAFAAVGVEARFDALPYARCAAQTQAGALMACFNTIRTAHIEADYLWPARPMFDERYLIWARADATVPPAGGLQLHDLEGELVAVTRGYQYGSEFDGNSRIRRVVTSHDASNFRLLLRGRARYTLAPDINTRLLFKRHPELAGKFQAVGQLSPFGLYVAFSRRHPQTAEMLVAFDEGLKIIQANGVARAIQERWRQRAAGP